MQLKEKIRRFMIGRYGMDDYNRALFLGGVILFLVGEFLPNIYLSLLITNLGLLSIFYGYVRMVSRNITRRYEQNCVFLEKTKKIRDFFSKKIWILKQQKEYHIYKCPGCGQKIRIPRGKGRIQITCPKCHESFIKNS